MSEKPAIVFCHGVWADGSCFNKVIPALQADGHEVIAVQYGLDTLADDVAAVKRTLGRVNGPTILVGHSYGGATVTAGGVDDRVVGLVYIAAVTPETGESVQNLLDKYPTEVFSHVEVADGRAWMLPEGVKYFAGRLARARAESCVGDPLSARRRPIRAQARRRCRLEVEAELVHRGQG
jgi:pimeloyl-ACP methyl ester carboxylesterase